ncbi:hypothetical protein F4776DRAFT_533847 [Hypoxylon sp. NC0597]|nr:hypothetical protein F4776DRAFT_533847 [Hypoxylon sp. NC0597]
MPHPIQRSACDRCHGQKLRCMRTASGGACIRCAKARATCTWSPSLRCKRRGSRSEVLGNPSDGQNGFTDSSDGLNPRNSVDEDHAPLLSDPVNAFCQFPQPDTDFNFGTDAFQCDSTLWSTPLLAGSTSGSSPTLVVSTNSPPQSTSQTAPRDSLSTWQDRFNREWAMLSAEQYSLPKSVILEDQSESPKLQEQDAPGLSLAIIKGLSDLNVELFSLSSAVPKPPTSTTQPLSWKDKDFAIDKTFQLSQKFIEALDRLYPRHQGSTAIDHVSSPVQGPPAQFDDASFLLVLSCYQRLIETYDDIFGNMQACLDRSAITAPEDYVPMPDMKVGSFSLPNSSALQITLVLQLARHLIKRMDFIIKALDQSRNLTSCDANDLMSLTFKAVSTRETDLIERINKLRNTLVSLDIL